MKTSKQEIEKYFGSIEDYNEYFQEKIYKCERIIADLESSELDYLFHNDLIELTDKNRKFTDCLNKCKNAMVEVFKTQLAEYREMKGLANKL
jgi:hypothetical protein